MCRHLGTALYPVTGSWQLTGVCTDGRQLAPVKRLLPSCVVNAPQKTANTTTTARAEDVNAICRDIEQIGTTKNTEVGHKISGISG